VENAQKLPLGEALNVGLHRRLYHQGRCRSCLSP